MKNTYLPKAEEIRYLEQNLTEAKINQRIVDEQLKKLITDHSVRTAPADFVVSEKFIR